MIDQELTQIAEYLTQKSIMREEAYSIARYCLMDALGCAILALSYHACKKLLGPVVLGTAVPYGARVPGTRFELDPILGAFNIGSMIRWLDFNDTWLAAEWGHPSDNLGAILAVSDYVSRRNIAENKAPLTLRDVLLSMIKAYEIQGMLALKNSFNRFGIDHVILVKIASSAIAMQLMGGTQEDIINVLSQAFIDGHSLRTYRHAPNTGSRKSWAAGDATSRGVYLAWLTLHDEMGYHAALSAKTYGFNDAVLKGQRLQMPEQWGSYVIENILFKIPYPAEFHAQTALECAIQLHPQVKNRFDDIEKINIATQESAMRIINKTGPLHNPADRDHCLQYIAAIGLLFGNLTAEHYENDHAKDPRIDAIREKMIVEEDPQFSKDYLDPEKRAIPNSIQIHFKDGKMTDKIQIDYPLGHPRRRSEGIPLLIKKFENNLATHYTQNKIEELKTLFHNPDEFDRMPVNEWMNKLI